MEKKSEFRPVPLLGRIQLRKRVASTSERDQPGTPVDETRALKRRVLIAESDDLVREAMCRLLPAEHFETVAFADGDTAWRWAQSNEIDLALLDRELPRIPGTRLCEVLRSLPHGGSIGIVLVSTAYVDPYSGAGDASTYHADAFLPLPASPDLVQTRIAAALARREPIARLGVLPLAKAQAIDRLFQSLNTVNYYELLQIDSDASASTLKMAFHRQSLILHPDRYARLRHTHAHAYERINDIYKRITEAHRVLCDRGMRARYNLGLQQRGELRLSKSRASQREEKELAMCRTDAARSLVLQSLDMRSLGDLEAAEPPMAEACMVEPQNEDLAQVLGAIRKLLDIMQRG
ncbi:MAG: DNA-binding response OmpR family regulator [Bradymonadia bacterium]